MRKLGWGLWAPVLVACSGGTPGTGSSSSSGTPDAGPPPLTLQTFFAGLNETGCAYEERCAITRGRLWSSLAECTASLTQNEQFFQAAYGQDLYAYWAAHYTFAEPRARACLDNLTARSCDDLQPRDADCEAALVVTAPVPDGALCNDSPLDDIALCTDAASYCEQSATSPDPQCTVCKALLADTQNCSASGQCASGFCTGGTDGTDGTCAAPAFKLKGQPCHRTDECLGNLVCAGPPASSTCQERVGPGGVCDLPTEPNPRRCTQGLQCVRASSTATTGTCTVRQPDGASCTREAEAVQCRNVCVFAAATAATGTCGVVTALPGAGSPCVTYREQEILCELMTDTVYPEVTITVVAGETTYTSCECRTKVERSGACHYASACESGPCQGGGFDAASGTWRTGSCELPLANGTSCRNDTECESGHCAPNAGGGGARCAAPPACP
ncbi:MAG: hypothetical protein HY904_21455 [Deltaproteobacteria bacterium]|nr:hypothetical protein [Deltaproteobacteria bacterium]